MSRFAVVPVLFLIFPASPALAQRGGGSVPVAGASLPVVTVLNEVGDEFSTASLRGKHTVLVFGCLT